MRRLAIATTMLACALLGQGCATQVADPTKPTTFDLLFNYEDLNAYLDQRRAVLAQLRAQISAIDAALLAQIGKLDTAKEELGTAKKVASARAADVAAVEADIANLRSRADRLYRETLDLDPQISLQAQSQPRSPQAAREDAKAVAELRQQVAKKEAGVAVLDDLVRDIINIRLRNAIGSEPGT